MVLPLNDVTLLFGFENEKDLDSSEYVISIDQKAFIF